MPEGSVVKYHVKLKFDVDGVVEKADLIGAIFGQTEGLFGPEMNLNELQKTWKVGRIEISLESKNGRTAGEVIIPMSTDVSTAALIAAAVESVDKVGPCAARFQLEGIDDVRAIKRKVIADRAKSILKDWASRTSSESEELLRDVSDSARRAKVVTFGRDELPAGPGVFLSDTIYVVEGRADVINLLRAGIENVVAIEGTKVPESVAKLGREKKLIAFLDGDRGGDLILKELQQITSLSRVVRAPTGKEVEELTPIEILQLLRAEPAAAPPKPEGRPPPVPEPLVQKVKEVYPGLNEALEAAIFNENLEETGRTPVSELVSKLETFPNAKTVIFDGIISQRLLDACSRVGVSTVIGQRKGDIERRPENVSFYTFKELRAA